MSLLTIILFIVAIGVVMWAINRFVPMQPGIRSVLNALVTVLLIVWLLDVFGLIDVLRNTEVGPVN